MSEHMMTERIMTEPYSVAEPCSSPRFPVSKFVMTERCMP
ncbi:hypothetical protein LCGC14_2682600, partial [marine sediment metagenome]